jgi:hypothetical protein
VWRGAHGGTYACRELVIAYAAWIDAKFHLRVLRVFLASVAPPAPLSVVPGAPASVHHIIRRLEETRRHPLCPEKISLDIISDTTLFIIDKPSFPMRVGDILTRTPEGLFHPAAPGVNLFIRLKDQPMNLPRLPDSLDLTAKNQSKLMNPPVWTRPRPSTPRWPGQDMSGAPLTVKTLEKIIGELKDWARNNLPRPAKDELLDALNDISSLVVAGWTEVDEALASMSHAMRCLNRWQDRGGRIGNIA